VCKKAKYILQKPTPKIKQSTIQLAISQLFQKVKNRSTNKQVLSFSAHQKPEKQLYMSFFNF
jgi:hypothetical protein